MPLGGRVQIGPFDVEFVSMAHSIPESNALIIRTPAGAVLHTGDWKIDPTPILGLPTDETKLRKLGEEGCLPRSSFCFLLSAFCCLSPCPIPGRAFPDAGTRSGVKVVGVGGKLRSGNMLTATARRHAPSLKEWRAATVRCHLYGYIDSGDW